MVMVKRSATLFTEFRNVVFPKENASPTIASPIILYIVNLMINLSSPIDSRYHTEVLISCNNMKATDENA